jgi:diguanylate cyclase (GGDEF)-like protein
VLVCDHRGSSDTHVVALLSELGFDVVHSRTLRRSIESVASLQPSLVIVDPMAGAAAAELGALDRARGKAGPCGLLLVVDSAAPLPGSLVAPGAPAGGPLDWVRRGAPRDELAARVETLMRQIERQREMERLRHVATHDDKTDLLRPQVFQEQLRQHFSASQRHHLDLALLLLDLDRFGQVNKVHDHTVGDQIITRVGAAMRRALRAEDVAGRIGGDEFCVLLPYTRKVDAARVVQRLLEHIRTAGEGLELRADLGVSASLGFETFNGSDLESVEVLRLHAEAALRAAKRAGGDCGIYFRNLDTAPGR